MGIFVVSVCGGAWCFKKWWRWPMLYEVKRQCAFIFAIVNPEVMMCRFVGVKDVNVLAYHCVGAIKLVLRAHREFNAIDVWHYEKVPEFSV
ncbi:hypothetical protein ACLHIJ_08040 [Trueperella sp. LYQ141]